MDKPETGGRAVAGRRQSSASRRAGYAAAMVIDAMLLFAIEVWPGWRSVDVLTPEAAAVVVWVDAALVVGILVNLLNLLFDRRWLKAVGDLLTTVIGLISAIVAWNIFPFDFSGVGGAWEIVARVFLIIAIGGSAIGIIVALVVIARIVMGRPGH